MRIGNIELRPGAIFAPMAGFSDAGARAAAFRWGASATVSEMVSAKALSMGDGATRRLMARAPGDGVYGIQLFGAEEKAMEAGAEAAMAFQPDFIDINMGCPVPKVVKTGAGSALLADPEKAGAMVAAVLRGCGGAVPVTAKLRLGINGRETAPAVARACEAAGAAALTVHGRTREEMYRPPVHPEGIARVKAAVAIPVVANGDIACGADALSMLAATGCDGVMVGRAALGAPWLFGQIAAALTGQPIPPAPPLPLRMEEMVAQVAAAVAVKGEDAALREARSGVMYFMRGLRGAAGLRKRAVSLSTMEDLRALAREALAQNAEE